MPIDHHFLGFVLLAPLLIMLVAEFWPDVSKLDDHQYVGISLGSDHSDGFKNRWSFA